LTFATCNVSLACQVEIPFTGSGITVYGVLIPGGTNISVSIDGRTAPAPNNIPLTPATSPAIYHVTLYNLQSLTFGFHTLVVHIVGWGNYGASELGFDYAYINETDPSANSLSPDSRSTVGPVVGGVFAGLVIIAIISAFLYVRRRRVAAFVIDPELDTLSSDPYDSRLHPPSPQPFTTYPSALFTRNTVAGLHFNGNSGVISSWQDNNSQLVTPSNPGLFIPPIPSTTAADQNNRRSSSIKEPHVSGVPQILPLNQVIDVGSRLTDDQADFVHTLHDLNVQPREIAHVIKRMAAGAALENSSGGSVVQDGNGHADASTAPPPSYEFESPLV